MANVAEISQEAKATVMKNANLRAGKAVASSSASATKSSDVEVLRHLVLILSDSLHFSMSVLI